MEEEPVNDLSLPASSTRRRRLRRGAGVVAVVVIGAAATLSVRAAAGTGDRGYRTAVVGQHDVSATLTSVGTIEPVSQASVAFPVAGTVDAVAVATGNTVHLGQTLATLDATELERSLRSAQADLAEAELNLEKALNGEDVSSSGPQTAPASTSSDSAGTVVFVSASTSAQAGPTGTSGQDSELRAAQQAVLDAQQQVDADLAAAQAALDQATTICTAIGEDPSTNEDLPADDETASEDETADVTACRDALQAVLDAQTKVAASQAAVEEAAEALTALLEERASTSGGSSSNGGNGSSTSVPDSGSSGTSGSMPSDSGGSGGSTSSSSSPSASDLIAYQKKVDAAAAQVAVAEQAVAQGTIVSPIAGTVVSVGLAAGDEVTAGSSTATIVVDGEGGFEVTTTVAVTDLPDVELGAAATVLPDGSTAPITGEVVAIGVGATTDGSTTSYPVTIGLTGDTSDAALGNGATATVDIVTAETTNALAVPTSAVTTDGDRSTVQVVADGEATEVVVEIGAVGTEWTEITDGLSAGDVVALADLDEPLPTSATESSGSTGTGGPTGGGGFPGGGNFTPPSGGPPGMGG